MLRQGLRGEHVLALALMLALSDALLIKPGVLGFGTRVRLSPALPQIMSLAGALFPIAYGAARLVAAWRGGAALAGAQISARGWPGGC